MIIAEFTFSSPAVLVGLVFMLIPLALHLFGRTRAKTIKFPMMRFVKQAAIKTYHRRRVENIALLLARMALFGFVPLALALPFYRSKNLRFSQKGNLALAVIIDNTASMQQRYGKADAFAQAKIEAMRVIRGSEQFPAPGLAAIVTPLASLNSSPMISTDITEITNRIRNLKCTDAETDITPTIIRAEKILENQPYANKLIYVLSDFQRQSLQPTQLKILKAYHIPVVMLGIADDKKRKDNIGISGVKISSPVIAGKSLTLTITLAGRVSSDRNVRIKLIGDKGELIASRDVVIASQKSFSQPYSLEFTPKRQKYFAGRVELEISDSLLADNRYYLAFRIGRQLKALVISQPKRNKTDWSSDPAFFVSSALQASGWITAERVSFDKLSSKTKNDVNAIYLCEPSKFTAAMGNALRKYLHSGSHSLVIFPDINSPKTLRGILKQFQLGRLISIKRTEKPARIEDIDTADALIASLGLKTSVYRKIALGSYAEIKPATLAESVLSLSDGKPALIHKKISDSDIYLFASPARISAGTLPLNAAFPAIICNIAAQTAKHNRIYIFDAGRSFRVKVDEPTQLTDDKGRLVRKFRKGNWQTLLYRAGLYYLQNQNPIAINCSSKAVDLAGYTVDEINKGQRDSLVFAGNSSADIEKHLISLAKGKPLWDYILLSAVIIMVLETLLANLRKPSMVK